MFSFVRFSRNKSALTQPDYFENVATPGAGAVGTTPFIEWRKEKYDSLCVNVTVAVRLLVAFAARAKQALRFTEAEYHSGFD
jgi:hypothetical protein